MKIGIFFSYHILQPIDNQKKKKKWGGGTVVQLVQLGGNSQKWANNRCSAENFFIWEKIRDFLSHHILLPIVDLKNIGRGAAQWSTGWK
jgi:hypothetical protein